MVVLVAGASGQLGQSLRFLESKYPEIEFVFCGSQELDITSKENCEQVFAQSKPDFCINAAAYTAVDKAESEPEKAFEINVLGAKNLAEVCKENNATLIHVSTDFVFDGKKTTPYLESDAPNPTGIYGQTKLDGEIEVEKSGCKNLIIRTSWVYSQFGNNFMKTMIRLGREKENLSVVNDQIGTPTNAVDLAAAILEIISQKETVAKAGEQKSRIYHYSNEGSCSWFDFAKKIFEINDIKIKLTAIPSSSYPTPAERPKYSVLDKSKIKNDFGIRIKPWEERLKKL